MCQQYLHDGIESDAVQKLEKEKKQQIRRCVEHKPKDLDNFGISISENPLAESQCVPCHPCAFSHFGTYPLSDGEVMTLVKQQKNLAVNLTVTFSRSFSRSLFCHDLKYQANDEPDSHPSSGTLVYPKRWRDGGCDLQLCSSP